MCVRKHLSTHSTWSVYQKLFMWYVLFVKTLNFPMLSLLVMPHLSLLERGDVGWVWLCMSHGEHGDVGCMGVVVYVSW